MSHLEWFLFTCLQATSSLDRHPASFVYCGTTGGIFLLYWWLKLNLLFLELSLLCKENYTCYINTQNESNFVIAEKHIPLSSPPHHCNTPMQQLQWQWNNSLLFPQINLWRVCTLGPNSGSTRAMCPRVCGDECQWKGWLHDYQGHSTAFVFKMIDLHSC